jgi:hypothetical protein
VSILLHFESRSRLYITDDIDVFDDLYDIVIQNAFRKKQTILEPDDSVLLLGCIPFFDDEY